MIHYIKGDATNPLQKPTVLIHVVNNKGGWGKGFVLAISKKWIQPEKEYRKWYNSDDFQLGNVQFVEVEEDIVVANMLAQDGYGGVALNYESLKQCLKKVKIFAKDRFICGPKIGSGLAGGDWNKISQIIEEELEEVYIYQL